MPKSLRLDRVQVSLRAKWPCGTRPSIDFRGAPLPARPNPGRRACPSMPSGTHTIRSHAGVFCPSAPGPIASPISRLRRPSDPKTGGMPLSVRQLVKPSAGPSVAKKSRFRMGNRGPSHPFHLPPQAIQFFRKMLPFDLVAVTNLFFCGPEPRRKEAVQVSARCLPGNEGRGPSRSRREVHPSCRAPCAPGKWVAGDRPGAADRPSRRPAFFKAANIRRLAKQLSGEWNLREVFFTSGPVNVHARRAS